MIPAAVPAGLLSLLANKRANLALAVLSVILLVQVMAAEVDALQTAGAPVRLAPLVVLACNHAFALLAGWFVPAAAPPARPMNPPDDSDAPGPGGAIGLQLPPFSAPGGSGLWHPRG
jgi:hypothetical protein